MISKTAEYALRAAVILARHQDAPLLTAELAEETQVPAPYLAKVLLMLRRRGLVRSKHGRGGGITLAKSADGISALDVVEAVDPVARIDGCPLGIEAHDPQLCPLHRRLDEVAALLQKWLAETNMAELAADGAPNAPLCRETKANHRAKRKPSRSAAARRKRH